MAKPLRKAKERLRIRQQKYDLIRTNKNAFKRPGSMNRHKG